MKARRRTGTEGFTLIELSIVVVIIGLLAAIAIPNYVKLVYKSRRAEAYAALRAMSIHQESFFSEYASYASTFDQMGYQMEQMNPIDATTISGPFYTYTLTPTGPSGYEWTNFRVTAVGDIDPTDVVQDVVIIENQLTVVGP